jgi:hypothetical protein
MSEITDGPALDGGWTDDGACPGRDGGVCRGERSGATATPAAVAAPSVRRQFPTTGLRR